jgi:hypothetical protein
MTGATTGAFARRCDGADPLAPVRAVTPGPARLLALVVAGQAHEDGQGDDDQGDCAAQFK